jgi:hypothetical protein
MAMTDTAVAKRDVNLEQLKEPFPVKDLEWRIQRSGLKDGRPWALVLCYINGRAVQDRLDAVCGMDGWKNEFAPGPNGGTVCGISIKLNDEWVTKWDGADNTNYEPVKGGLSDAFKRAAVHWGIGRYLYRLEANWAVFVNDGRYRDKIEDKYYKWDPPESDLPDWAIPTGEKKPAPAIRPKEEYGEEGSPKHDLQWYADQTMKGLQKMFDKGWVDQDFVDSWMARIDATHGDVDKARDALQALLVENDKLKKQNVTQQTFDIPDGEPIPY